MMKYPVQCLIAHLFLAFVAHPALGSEPLYQPVGAPADPKVPVRWNRYYDYAEATDLLKAFASEHKELARLRSLGRSYGGREIWLLTISNPATGKHHSKLAI